MSSESGTRPLPTEPPRRCLTLQQRFELFDASNPHIYEHFKAFTLALRAAGIQRYGAKSIMERIRWHVAIETGNDSFKINNNYTSRYVRKLVAEYPELRAFFEMRTLLAD
ncbi:MAG: hypothetical protein IRY99_17985 [Isosphaeraceae bacterium]|nr:hypothetical protein [Isosphaeraceae bacterium]